MDPMLLRQALSITMPARWPIIDGVRAAGLSRHRAPDLPKPGRANLPVGIMFCGLCQQRSSEGSGTIVRVRDAKRVATTAYCRAGSRIAATANDRQRNLRATAYQPRVRVYRDGGRVQQSSHA
jgi:hypothetical protein